MQTADSFLREVPGSFREDWGTYEGNLLNPGLWVMAVYRFGRWRYGIRPRLLRIGFSFAYKLLFAWVRAASGAEIPCEARVGRRLRIDHSYGIVVSGDAWLGDDVVLRNGVTLGLRSVGMRGSPVIGHRVDIGTGAKILGAIHVGDGACIGANAVVLTDVPPNSIAFGVPARICLRKDVGDRAGDLSATEQPLA
jgi:serine O-acetyltransferase